MYHPYSISFFLGLIMLQLPTIVAGASCPPGNKNNGTTVKFCTDSEVTSSSIFLDSSDVTRVANCSCYLTNTKGGTKIFLKSTLNQTNDCRTKISYGLIRFPFTSVECGTVDATMTIQQDFIFTHILLLTHEQINLEPHCLHLYTDNAIEISLNCVKDTPIITTPTTSTEPPATTKGTTSLDSGSSTTGTSSTDTSTSTITIQHATTIATSTNADKNKGLPVNILAPTVGGGVLVVIFIIILATVLSRRKRKRNQQYDEPGPKGDAHSYMNQAVVHDEDDDDGDDMRDNDLYRSMDDDPLDDDNTGGYAEINSTDLRDKNTFIDFSNGYAEVELSTCLSISNTDSTYTQKGQIMHSIPINRPLKQVQGGVVYSMSVKKPKTLKLENNDAPVYAMPDKKKNQQDFETGPMYAIVNKKTKNDPKNSKTNASKAPINNKPPVVTPKRVVAESGSENSGGNVNKNRLNHSDIELNNSRTTTSSLEFNVSDKTGYAEVL